MKKLITIALSLLLLPFLAQSQPLPNTLTPDQKAYELSLIWREMAYNFDNMDHCAEVDADSLYRAFVPVVRATEDDYAYSKAIMRYLASFQNSHTYVVDAPWLVAPLAQPYIRTEYRDGKLFLTNFASKYADRMRVGDEVVRINGVDAVTYMRENMLPCVPATNNDHRLQIAMSFMGLWTLFPYGTMFDLTLKGDTLYQLSLPAEKLVDDPSNDWYVNDYERNKENICYIDHTSGTGYLRLTDCFETGKQFFLQHKDSLAECQHIILDLTHNVGGQSFNTDDVVGFLAKVDSFSSETILSKMNIAYMKAQGSYRCWENADPDDIVCQMKNGTYFYTIPSTRYPNPYYPDNFKGKVMVIQGNNTASAAEWLVSRLHQDKSIVFYGEKTSGATGNPYQLNLPSGMIVRFNTWRTFGPDGTETSYGFAPDIPMDFSDCYKATTAEELFRRLIAKIEGR